jgi:hypothetical protein
MKTHPHNKKTSSGYALMMVLFMITVSMIVLQATVNRTSGNSKQNDRNVDYFTAVNAAEAATEKVIARMRADYNSGSDTRITNSLASYRAGYPDSAEDAFWGNFSFSDGQGNYGQTYISCISNSTYSSLQSQYYGLSGWRTVYRLVSNARYNTGLYRPTGAVQQDVETDSIPIFQFAIFYNGLLEFTWAAPLTVRGRTHANGNIHVGSSAPLVFQDMVTTTGTIALTNWGGHTLSEYAGSITYANNNNGGYSTQVPAMSLPIGTNNTAAAVREIVNMPPAGEDVNSAMGLLRFYNKAGMDLLISNNAVVAIIKNSAGDASPVTITASYNATNYGNIVTNFPFLTLTNTFKDQRENKTVLAAQIDIAKYKTWAANNPYTMPSGILTKHPSSNPLNILYVADNRTNNSTQLSAIRILNGTNLPANVASDGIPTGFTIATPNPLYVWGDYNCTNSAYLGTTNTSATVPSALISDALTIQSKSWSDASSSSSYTLRNAADTTVNAALLAGVVYSAGSTGNAPFSGGVVNFPRLLESWSGHTLTLNTSIVNLYDSVKATAPWQIPTVYYSAPSRNFNFDANFKNKDKLPPGTPTLGLILRSRWTIPPPGTVNYAGN